MTIDVTQHVRKSYSVDSGLRTTRVPMSVNCVVKSPRPSEEAWNSYFGDDNCVYEGLDKAQIRSQILRAEASFDGHSDASREPSVSADTTPSIDEPSRPIADIARAKTTERPEEHLGKVMAGAMEGKVS